MGNPVEVTDANFDEQVLKSSVPVLVDFWADWCAPCKMIAPILEELANEYDGKIAFAKVDVDSNPETSLTFGIRSIPNLLVFKNGKPMDQVIGAVPKAVLKKRLDNALA